MKVSSRARNLNDMWYVLVYQHVHCCIVACESFLYNNCPESFCCCVHVAMKTVLLITYPYILHHFTFCHFISIQALDFSLEKWFFLAAICMLSYNFWLFPLSMPWTNKHQSTCRCGGVRKGLNRYTSYELLNSNLKFGCCIVLHAQIHRNINKIMYKWNKKLSSRSMHL